MRAVADRITALILSEGTWLPIAMTAALAAVAALFVSHRHAAMPPRRLIMAMMNLFAGVTLAIMGAGHLLAVAIRHAQGTLEGSPALLYSIGMWVSVPAWLVTRHTAALLRPDDDRRETIGLNTWLAAALVIAGLVNIPLAIPLLLNIGYRVHARRSAGIAIVATAIAVHAFLLIGGLIFMASGQTFEQFSGTE